MSRTKSPSAGVRQRARELRERRENRLAVWTIAVTIGLGLAALVVLYLRHPPEAHDEHARHPDSGQGVSPSIHP